MMLQKNTLGIFSWFGYRLHLRDRFQLIRQAGFGTTSVWWGQEEDPAMFASLPQIARDTGLALDNMHVPFEECNGLWSENASLRNALVDKHFAWLDDCVRVGIPRMVMHVSFEEGPAINAHGIESVRRIVQAAEERGIIVAVENTRRHDCIDIVLTEIVSPKLGFCFDSSHERLYGDAVHSILRRWGHRLVVTHFSDNDGLADRHWLPGGPHGHEDCSVDWTGIARAFPRGFSGCLHLEVQARGEPTDPPDVFLGQAWRSIVWLAKLIEEAEG